MQKTIQKLQSIDQEDYDITLFVLTIGFIVGAVAGIISTLFFQNSMTIRVLTISTIVFLILKYTMFKYIKTIIEKIKIMRENGINENNEKTVQNEKIGKFHFERTEKPEKKDSEKKKDDKTEKTDKTDKKKKE